MGWLKEIVNSGKSEDDAEDALQIPLASFQTWLQQEKTALSSEILSQLYDYYAEIVQLSNSINSIQEKIADRVQRLARAEDVCQVKELALSQFQADPEISLLISHKARRDEIQRKLHAHRDLLDDQFFVIRRILEKSSNQAFNGPILKPYFFDALQALLNDRSLHVILQLKTIQAALESQQVAVTVKEMELLYSALEKLGPSALTAIQQDCITLQKELAGVSNELVRKDLLQKVEDVDYWLQHHRQLAGKLKEEMRQLGDDSEVFVEQRQIMLQELKGLLYSGFKRKIAVVM